MKGGHVKSGLPQGLCGVAVTPRLHHPLLSACQVGLGNCLLTE